jgi:hypothetical protein
MASLMDKMTHAAAVAKWKADQQVRIMRAQNSVREMENQVRSQKADIAEITLALYAKDALTEGQLIPLCQQISQIHSQIQSINQTIEAIKQEQAPADPSLNSSAYQPATNGSVLSCARKRGNNSNRINRFKMIEENLDSRSIF